LKSPNPQGEDRASWTWGEVFLIVELRVTAGAHGKLNKSPEVTTREGGKPFP